MQIQNSIGMGSNLITIMKNFKYPYYTHKYTQIYVIYIKLCRLIPWPYQVEIILYKLKLNCVMKCKADDLLQYCSLSCIYIKIEKK